MMIVDCSMEINVQHDKKSFTNYSFLHINQIQIYDSMISLHILHFTLLFTVAKPISSLSVNSLVMMTSRFGSIWRSINVFFSVKEKIIFALRPSQVSCSISWSGMNFWWCVLNGICVLKQNSLSPVFSNSQEDGICFATFRVRKFKPENKWN